MYMILLIPPSSHYIFDFCYVVFFLFLQSVGILRKQTTTTTMRRSEHFLQLILPTPILSGAVSERCGTDYLADMEKVGEVYKPIADKSKWTVPENNPFYYARMCHPGEKCVIGYYKNERFPPGRSESMKASAGKCVPCEGNGEYTDGSLKNPAKCSQCPIGQFTREKYAKSCTKCPKGKHITWCFGCI